MPPCWGMPQQQPAPWSSTIVPPSQTTGVQQPSTWPIQQLGELQMQTTPPTFEILPQWPLAWPAHPTRLLGQTIGPTAQAVRQQRTAWPSHPNPPVVPLTLPQQPPSNWSMQQNTTPPHQSLGWGTSQTTTPSGDQLQLIAFKQRGGLIRAPDLLRKCTEIAVQKTTREGETIGRTSKHQFDLF
ncbi:unnamed protein product [Sphagnum jensenii]|uniref:Uncharacterized protein n=1 Tax=Sphagnum jensenii TaxID=128206 RepID=A0ABP1B0Z1_9BRYO